MLFSSPIFFLFFAVYFALHLAVPVRFRAYLIIAGSTIFYAWWKISYAWLPFMLVLIAFPGALWVVSATTPQRRRTRVLLVVAGLFLPLLSFKYTDFVYRDVIGSLAGFHDRLLGLPLPLGISFVTFTLTAYVVDIYRGKFPADTKLRTVVAYILFFPHLIAGPILRPHELIPQLERPRNALRAHYAPAVAIFTLGLVKKLLVADQVAAVVDAVYGQAAPPSAPAAFFAIYAFTVQLYCDFSGYTDMAIGVAMLLGVRLPNNFERPFCAASLVEFWRRWHMTLSYWLRDYLYIPLGGSRRGSAREIWNILVTMTLGGLWHGAAWTFVVWGLMNGLGITWVHSWGRFVRWRPWSRLPRWLGVALTFHFFALSLVFFRAASIDQAGRVFAALGGGWSDFAEVISVNGFAAALVVIFLFLHRFDDHRRVKLAMRRLRPEIAWSILGMLWIVAVAVSQGNSAKFIYFDF